jgi:ketosteroid isomerase-like protein
VRREYVGAAHPGDGARFSNSERQSEEEQIRGLETTWRAALTAKDTTAIRHFYVDRGYYLPQWSTGCEGPGAIANRWADEITGGGFTLEREPRTIEVADAADMAYEVGTYKVAWSKPSKAAAEAEPGTT